MDLTPPSLAPAAIVDSKNDFSITANAEMIYTEAFSGDMDGIPMTAADSGNAGTATISIDSVIASSSGVFTCWSRQPAPAPLNSGSMPGTTQWPLPRPLPSIPS